MQPPHDKRFTLLHAIRLHKLLTQAVALGTLPSLTEALGAIRTLTDPTLRRNADDVLFCSRLLLQILERQILERRTTDSDVLRDAAQCAGRVAKLQFVTSNSSFNTTGGGGGAQNVFVELALTWVGERKGGRVACLLLKELLLTCPALWKQRDVFSPVLNLLLLAETDVTAREPALAALTTLLQLLAHGRRSAGRREGVGVVSAEREEDVSDRELFGRYVDEAYRRVQKAIFSAELFDVVEAEGKSGVGAKGEGDGAEGDADVDVRPAGAEGEEPGPRAAAPQSSVQKAAAAKIRAFWEAENCGKSSVVRESRSASDPALSSTSDRASDPAGALDLPLAASFEQAVLPPLNAGAGPFDNGLSQRVSLPHPHNTLPLDDRFALVYGYKLSTKVSSNKSLFVINADRSRCFPVSEFIATIFPLVAQAVSQNSVMAGHLAWFFLNNALLTSVTGGNWLFAFDMNSSQAVLLGDGAVPLICPEQDELVLHGALSVLLLLLQLRFVAGRKVEDAEAGEWLQHEVRMVAFFQLLPIVCGGSDLVSRWSGETGGLKSMQYVVLT